MTDRRHSAARIEAERIARITCQFRDKQAMVYELECEGTRLVVTMSDEEPSAFRIEASVRDEHGPPKLAASGKSRKEALQAVAEVWTRLGEGAGYARVDWDAVSRVLETVRAV